MKPIFSVMIGEETETIFIRVWKPLLSRRVLKPGVEAQREQYLLAVDLGHYKWYQSWTMC